MQRDLVLPPRLAITALERATDHEALESARHTLAAFLSYMAAAVERAGFELGPVPAGMAAVQSVIDRHARTGVYRASGPELLALREAVDFCDAALPRLDTAVLMHALLRVYDAYGPATHSKT